MSAAEYRNIAATSSSVSQRIDESTVDTVVESRGPATILTFPVSPKKIRHDLLSVRDYEPAARFRFLTALVRQRRSRLVKLGVSPDRIAADVRALEEAYGLAG